MKLTIAAGILAQTLLGAVAEKAAISVVQEQTFDLASILSSIPRRDVDGFVAKSQGKRRIQKNNAVLSEVSTKRSGLLTNQRRSHEGKDCDPNSQDPDVGILSCGPERYCRRNKASLMGGRCELTQENNLGITKALSRIGRGGVLNNAREVAAMTSLVAVECDPRATPDIGILSCGEGKQCVASTASSMGGFCMESSSSRQLSHLSEMPGLCDPNSEMYMYYDCECSGYNNATGTGDIVCTVLDNYCLGFAYRGCGNVCVTRTVTYPFINFTSPGYGFCFDFASPYGDRVCFEETFETNECALTFNDQPCTSCNIENLGNYTSIAFDCSNAGGTTGTTYNGLTELLPVIGACYDPSNATIPECILCTAQNSILNPNFHYVPVTVPGVGEITCYDLFANAYIFVVISDNYCPAAAQAASESCCSSFCALCALGDYVPAENYDISLNIPITGYEDTTCGDLAYAAYYNFTINEQLCPSVSTIAQGACCLTATYDTCDICDGALVNPDSIVSIYGDDVPCSALEAVLNETACAIWTPLVSATCCQNVDQGSEPMPVSAPVPEPTPGPAPVQVPASETQVPSGASPRFGTKSFLSAIGLAAAAVVFVVN